MADLAGRTAAQVLALDLSGWTDTVLVDVAAALGAAADALRADRHDDRAYDLATIADAVTAELRVRAEVRRG